LRPLLFGENAIPIFVAPAKAGVQAWAHGALRFGLDPATYAHCCPEKMRYLSSSLRRRPESRLGRMALCAFAWIPTYAHCCPEKMRYLSSSLRRRPECRHSHA